METIKTIYCDFDGTITKTDAVNTFFEMYADEKWLESEALWIDGKISSMENAITQVALVRSVTQKQLDDYISSIELNDYFLEFVEFLNKNNIKLVILSDGFDLFINKVIEKYNIKNVEVYANHLIYENNKFKIEFPNHNKNCDIKAGMCKCSKVKEKEFCYIGDGTSDLCIAKKAKILFATKKLQEHCLINNINHFGFTSFRDIIKVLSSIIKKI